MIFIVLSAATFFRNINAATWSAIHKFDMWVRFMVKTSLIEMRLKQWERKHCKPNNHPMPYKMHVSVGDTIQVIAGHENSKVGEVVPLYKHKNTMIVKDPNLKSKHNKCSEDESGEIVMKNMTSRVRHHLLEDGTKVHYLKKTGVVIDNVDNQVKVFNERDSESSS
ncbi:hypothetical protein VPH35_050991 [Triticum aestivum]